ARRPCRDRRGLQRPAGALSHVGPERGGTVGAALAVHVRARLPRLHGSDGLRGRPHARRRRQRVARGHGDPAADDARAARRRSRRAVGQLPAVCADAGAPARGRRRRLRPARPARAWRKL
ncbi:MAG: hypothetical protein AVDCRST_MAG67-4449, partial [uncultured Solirubrobacteraceae bacterium]